MSGLKICPQCGSEYELDVRFCPNDGSTLKAQNSAGDLLGQIIADRYHVLRKLGEGGMGQVYLAEHVKMGRKSAVKVMHPGMVHDADSISRFNREAANASRINHPNVAAIYDFGETSDGLIYLAMEYIEGEALTSVIERLGALPPARVADIIRQASDALGVACDMGIVHRDLKPDNIMIARARDGADLVKVVDFGIAKATQSDAQKVTKTGLVVGTPEYMSPEQLAGDRMDGRSDIYSLGLVAFTMLTGKLPFPSETVQESMIMRLMERPRTLSQMKGDVAWPEELQAVMDRALARDVSERYQQAPDFGRDLVHAVAGMPEQALAEEGTLVMASPTVPPTRVGGGAGAGAGAVGAGATVKLAPVGGGKVATPRSEGAVPAKSRGPLVAVAAVALLAVLGAGGYMLSIAGSAGDPPTGEGTQVASLDPAAPAGGGDGTVPGSGVDRSGTIPPAGSGADAGTGSQAPPPVQPQPGSKDAGAARDADAGRGSAGRNPTSPPAAPVFENVDRELAALLAIIEKDDPPAEELNGVVSRATALTSRNISRDDKLRARFYRAMGWGMLGTPERACPELRELLIDASHMDFHSLIQPIIASTGCPGPRPDSDSGFPAGAAPRARDYTNHTRPS